MTANNYNLYVA